jgi:hypothetical protein
MKKGVYALGTEEGLFHVEMRKEKKMRILWRAFQGELVSEVVKM